MDLMKFCKTLKNTGSTTPSGSGFPDGRTTVRISVICGGWKPPDWRTPDFWETATIFWPQQKTRSTKPAESKPPKWLDFQKATEHIPPGGLQGCTIIYTSIYARSSRKKVAFGENRIIFNNYIATIFFTIQKPWRYSRQALEIGGLELWIAVDVWRIISRGKIWQRIVFWCL